MKIIIDCDYNEQGFPVAFQYLDTENADAMKTLQTLNDDKASHEAAGYNVNSRLPGIPEGTTRWQVVLNNTTRAEAPQELKSLALK